MTMSAMTAADCRGSRASLVTTVAPPLLDFASVVEKHGAALYRRAKWLTKSESDAADLFQDTIEHAMRGARKPDEPDLVLRWLMRIMYNLFIDQQRACAVWKRVARSQEVLARVVGEAPDPRPADWRLVDDAQLSACVSCLPAGMRELFQKYATGTSYPELAAHFNIPQGTVGTRLLRLRRRLRALLCAAMCCDDEDLDGEGR
jgi:RNA polymerase sigma-70 factor (ECF subfamily)